MSKKNKIKKFKKIKKLPKALAEEVFNNTEKYLPISLINSLNCNLNWSSEIEPYKGYIIVNYGEILLSNKFKNTNSMQLAIAHELGHQKLDKICEKIYKDVFKVSPELKEELCDEFALRVLAINYVKRVGYDKNAYYNFYSLYGVDILNRLGRNLPSMITMITYFKDAANLLHKNALLNIKANKNIKKQLSRNYYASIGFQKTFDKASLNIFAKYNKLKGIMLIPQDTKAYKELNKLQLDASPEDVNAHYPSLQYQKIIKKLNLS